MKKKCRTMISLALVLIFAFTLSMTIVYGTSTEDKLKEKKSELSQGQKQEANLSEEIANINSKITIAEGEVDNIESDIISTEAKIKTITKSLKEQKKKLDTGVENLNARLKNMYKCGTVGFIDVLLSSENVSELMSNVEMVKEIYNSDKELVGKLQNKYDVIETKQAELNQLQTALKTKKETLVEKQNTLTADKANVAAKKAKIADNNSALQEEVDDLQAQADEMTNEIKTWTDDGGSYSSGAMCWPVNGSVASPFGWRICPFHGKEFHTGIDIAATMGTPVVAAKGGTVQMASYTAGYGNTVMISHGGGIVTLYAHNSSILVSVGQTVKKGQQISRAGSTGSSTGPHCHFEVRKNGNYVNPMNYL